MDLTQQNQYCQNKAINSGSSFYFSFLFLAKEKRIAITALYAFCREIDDIVDESLDDNIARKKLSWWREEIERLFSDTPEHPISKALHPAIQSFHLPQEYFFELIDGMEMDLDGQAYTTFSDLSLYCYRVASVVGLMCAEIFGYTNRKTLKYAHNLGLAFQLTNILRDVSEDFERGRIYIPIDELEKFNVKHNELGLKTQSKNVRSLFEFQANRAFHYYKIAFDYLPENDRYAQLTGIIMAEIYHKTLVKIKKDNFNVLYSRKKLSALNKLWIAWRTAIREKSRNKKLK